MDLSESVLVSFVDAGDVRSLQAIVDLGSHGIRALCHPISRDYALAPPFAEDMLGCSGFSDVLAHEARTLLEYAAAAQHGEAAACLLLSVVLRAGQALHASSDSLTRTFLAAVATGKQQLVTTLAQHFRWLLDAVVDPQQQWCMSVAARFGQVDVAHLLVELGARVTSEQLRSYEKYSPLLSAVRCLDMRMVAFILELDVYRDSAAVEETEPLCTDTAAHFAARANRVDILQALRMYGDRFGAAQDGEPMYTALDAAYQAGSADAMTYIMQSEPELQLETPFTECGV